MGGKPRKAVPKRVAAGLEYQSNLQCCVCGDRGQQIHHLDSDPANNDPKNLALLCFIHHDEATRTGGLGRKLHAETIAKFRREWYAAVETGRSSPPTDTVPRKDLGDMLVALAIHEVRKIGHRLQAQRSWQDVAPLVGKLHPYAHGRDTAVSEEVLDVLDLLTTRTRAGMPAETAHAVSAVTAEATPTWNLVSRMGRPVTPAELSVIEHAVPVGMGLAYDGAKYLRDIRVVDAGADVLWKVLRFAHLNEFVGLKTTVIEAFDTARRGAKDHRQGPFKDAITWLDFKMADALAVADAPLPQMPWDIEKKTRLREV